MKAASQQVIACRDLVKFQIRVELVSGPHFRVFYFLPIFPLNSVKAAFQQGIACRDQFKFQKGVRIGLRTGVLEIVCLRANRMNSSSLYLNFERSACYTCPAIEV